MITRIWILFVARTREFYRDTGGLIWNIVFPLMIITGFAFAFSGGGQKSYKIGVYPASALQLPDTLFKTKHIDFIGQSDLAKATAKVGRQQLDMVISFGDTLKYFINASSPKGYLVERILVGSTIRPLLREEATGRQVRYVDWLVPGILAMNMMFSALFGVGWVIVRYRINGVLKRLKATPLRAYEFLTAQILSRMIVILASSLLVFCGANFFLHFCMLGSWLLLFLVFSLGTFCMISLGLLFAARFKSEEMVSGLLNFITWPMMFLSGVWFSLEGMHPVLKKLAQLLPLTHMIDAARAIMLDGAGFSEIIMPVSILAAMSFIFIAAGSILFKWE